MSAPSRRLELGRVGESVRRIDAIPKVTGEFAYASDLFAAGMLYGHTVRSPHSAAQVKAISTAEAKGMPGVHAVLTHRDVPGEKRYGLEFPDQPVLAMGEVRYFGEPVALVAAEHPEQARRAAVAVQVDYIPQQPVADPEKATEAVRELTIRRGDPDARGQVVVEGTYEIGMQDQAFMGPEVGLAVPDDDGGVDLIVSTQWLHIDRDQVAECLGLPPEKVRLTLGGVGGAFGAREDVSLHIHSCLLAMHTGRPVKMVYYRRESFLGHVHRHPARIWMRHSAETDGTIVSFGRGSCSTAAPTARRRSTSPSTPRVSRPARTARPTRTWRRSPCAPTTPRAARCAASAPCRWASPTRRRWTSSPPRAGSTRWSCACTTRWRRVTSCSPASASRAACRWRRSSGRAWRCRCPRSLRSTTFARPGGAGNTTDAASVVRRIGFAVGFKNLMYAEGYDDDSVARVPPRGRRRRPITSAAAEVGQGFVTLAQQFARTELPEIADVVIAPHSTAAVGSAGSSSASRQTWMTAGAVRAACLAVRDELRAPRRNAGTRRRDRRGARLPPPPAPSPLDPETGQITTGPAHVAFACAAMKVVVEVDVELGLTRVVWIGTARTSVGR